MGGRGGFGKKESNVGFPKNDSQLKHIFRTKKNGGHVLDSSENRRLLMETAKDEKNLVAIKLRIGSRLYTKELPDGSQVWVEVWRGIIQNGGVNRPPVTNWEKRGFKKI